MGMSIRNVMLKTTEVYRAGFKQFICLSAIYCMLIVLPQIMKGLPPGLLMLLGSVTILIVSIYFCSRAQIAMFLLTRKIALGETQTVKEAYDASKGMVWTFIVVTFLYTMILILPAIGIAVAYVFVESAVTKYGLIALLAIPLTFLAIRYYFAVPSAILSEKSNGEFQRSKLLVKGDFWSVFAVAVLTYCVFRGISQIFSVLADRYGSVGSVIMPFLDIAFWIVVSPITPIAAVLMYLALNDKKGIDTFDNDKKGIDAFDEI